MSFTLFYIIKKNEYFCYVKFRIKNYLLKLTMKITRIENDSLFVEYGNDFIIYYDGSNYKGEIKEIENSDNIRHGYGVMIYSNDKSSYIGCYKDNVKHGYGKYIYDNGDIYEGEFVNGLRCGKGKFISHNGYIVYDGEWQDDIKKGYGKYNFENGDTYEGEFVNDVRCGKGKFNSYNGYVVYDGEWKDDVRHGFGRCSYKEEIFHNGDNVEFYEEEYEGNWINGNKEGKGEIKIKGLWQDDVPISSIEIEKSRNIEKYISKKVSQYINNYFENKCDQAYYNMFPPDEKYYFY